MAITTEELRSLLFSWLKAARKTNPTNFQPQYLKCLQGINHEYALREGKEAEYQRGERFLDDRDAKALKQVLWDLILERVMIPGTDNEGNSGWPFLTVTEHGWKVVEATGPIPYDPDNYLARFQTIGIHPTSLRYLQESLATFKTGNYLASAVMLGAASERVFTDVVTSIVQSIADTTKRKTFETKARSPKMAERVRAVIEWCRNHKGQLVGDWKGNERVEVIDQLAHFIRKRRNETGHPQDPPAVPTHEEMYSWIVVFYDYCKSLYELKTFLDAKPGSIL